MISKRAATVTGLAIAGILFGVVYKFTGTAAADAVPRKPAPIPVQAALASRVDLPLYFDAIGTAQAGFRKTRGCVQGKKLSFGFLHSITDPNPAKLERWVRNESRQHSE